MGITSNNMNCEIIFSKKHNLYEFVLWEIKETKIIAVNRVQVSADKVTDKDKYWKENLEDLLKQPAAKVPLLQMS